MGKMVERIALGRGHTICCVVEEGEAGKFGSPEFRQADVAIDFTVPAAEPANVEACFGAGVPVVCGTTGWAAELGRVAERCRQGEGCLLWSSNFSIGVNVFRAVSRRLAELMDKEPQYSPELEEVHHVHKLDHPSGTAVTLAEDIVDSLTRLRGWEDDGESGTASAERKLQQAAGGTLPVEWRREGEVPGIHTIRWSSPQDSITLTHSANSREGFALGAVVAAEWLAAKHPGSGYFTMQDVLGI